MIHFINIGQKFKNLAQKISVNLLFIKIRYTYLIEFYHTFQLDMTVKIIKDIMLFFITKEIQII